MFQLFFCVVTRKFISNSNKCSYTLLKKAGSLYLRNYWHITLRNSFQVMVESEFIFYLVCALKQQLAKNKIVKYRISYTT